MSRPIRLIEKRRHCDAFHLDCWVEGEDGFGIDKQARAGDVACRRIAVRVAIL